MDKVRLNIQLINSLADALYVSPTEIISASGIANSTWYRIMQQPDTITIQHLLGIANGMHIPVRRFFYTGHTLIVGHRDDYIADPYHECRYDADALQEFVSNTDSATWMQAAKEIGVTRDNLRNSLLGTRRTPVIRFLNVCNIFGINPFTVLVDPNPETTKADRKAVPSSMRAEIDALRKEVSTLSHSVSELTEQYQHLLAQHEALLREFRAYRGDNNTHMAAEPIPDPTPDKE